MAVGRFNGVAVLKGNFSIKCIGVSLGPKKVTVLSRWPYYRGGRIIEVAVRRGSTVYVSSQLLEDLESKHFLKSKWPRL